MAQCAILALLSTNIYSHSISCCFHFVSSGLQAKLETKALKAKRPGFTDERYHETSYYVENGKYFFPHLLLYSKYLLSHNFYSMRTRCVCVCTCHSSNSLITLNLFCQLFCERILWKFCTLFTKFQIKYFCCGI